MALSLRANTSQFTFAAGNRQFLVVDFIARERLSELFQVDLTLAAEEEIPFTEITGRVGLLTVMGQDTDRYFHGIVNRFCQTGLNGRFYLYQARIVPQIWLLTLRQDCRIFQQKSLTDIATQILRDGGITSDLFAFRLQNAPQSREYCVQYCESDYHFISRLLEQEGVFYLIEHEQDKHRLVFGDSTVNYQPIAGNAQVVMNPGGGMVAEEESVLAIKQTHQITSGKYTLRDYNFERPSLDLLAERQDSENQHLEIYNYPGLYAEQAAGNHLAGMRLDAAMMYKDLTEGSSNIPRFLPGATFSLSDHDLSGFNREYVLIEVVHSGKQPQVLAERASEGEGSRYVNQFVAVPSSVTLRPETRTARPTIAGVQTAIVTGPSGEEIYTDQHGRVKVQFHWDRQGRDDENSSCWIRVSQLWAGAGWGAMFLPRIGQEVVVEFIEGNPDRPIVTGRVYHGTNTPPYRLPDEKTKSTVKSDSTTGGGGFNELRFEDKKDREEIFLHAQKDWNIGVEHDKTQGVGNDETLSVGHDRTKQVDNDQSETVGRNKTITVSGNHTEEIIREKTFKVGENCTETFSQEKKIEIGLSETKKVGKNLKCTINNDMDVDAGDNMTQNAGKDLSIQSGKKMNLVSGDNLVITSDKKGLIEIQDQLTIKCGNVSIVLKKNGDLSIEGKKISIKGSGDVVIKGSKIKEN